MPPRAAVRNFRRSGTLPPSGVKVHDLLGNCGRLAFRFAKREPYLVFQGGRRGEGGASPQFRKIEIGSDENLLSLTEIMRGKFGAKVSIARRIPTHEAMREVAKAKFSF